MSVCLAQMTTAKSIIARMKIVEIKRFINYLLNLCIVDLICREFAMNSV